MSAQPMSNSTTLSHVLAPPGSKRESVKNALKNAFAQPVPSFAQSSTSGPDGAVTTSSNRVIDAMAPPGSRRSQLKDLAAMTVHQPAAMYKSLPEHRPAPGTIKHVLIPPDSKREMVKNAARQTLAPVVAPEAMKIQAEANQTAQANQQRREVRSNNPANGTTSQRLTDASHAVQDIFGARMQAAVAGHVVSAMMPPGARANQNGESIRQVLAPPGSRRAEVIGRGTASGPANQTTAVSHESTVNGSAPVVASAAAASMQPVLTSTSTFIVHHNSGFRPDVTVGEAAAPVDPARIPVGVPLNAPENSSQQNDNDQTPSKFVFDPVNKM